MSALYWQVQPPPSYIWRSRHSCSASPDVNAPPRHVRGHEDVLTAVLEAGQGRLSLLLVAPTVKGGSAELHTHTHKGGEGEGEGTSMCYTHTHKGESTLICDTVPANNGNGLHTHLPQPCWNSIQLC